ncbi:thioredoxin domain-containing protein [Hyphomonas sp.]|uniref:thioredoxin domain-containing protein n=1 Tax=Hyphomonas sp. TaxID=87 RepID=UPI0025B97135|nr:thioredoxin domain-containing protein [Hyphomonas sp.]
MLKSLLTALVPAAILALPALADDLSIGHSKGSEDAPITLIEYGSVTCGGCKYFHDKIMPRVEQDYIETGKVRFIFREALRNDVDTALISMARCKGEDKFFAITDAIFERQPEIIKTAQAGTVLDTFLDIGAEFGIRTPAQFDACYENMNIRLDMIEVQETADLYELRGTPTLIVNGEEKYVDKDFESADAFAAYLDAQLAALSEMPADPAE